MKRIICIVLALVLVLGCLAGCGLGDFGSSKGESSKTESKKSDKNNKDDKKGKDDDGDDDDEGGEVPPAPSPEGGNEGGSPENTASDKPFLLHPLYTEQRYSAYSGKSGSLVESSTGYFSISEEDLKNYPYLAGLNSMLISTGERDIKSLRESFDYLTPMAEEFFESWENKSYDFRFEDSTKLYATRTDSSIFSVRAEYYGYSGGVHGYYGTGGLCYDSKTGKRLTLSDIISDRETFVSALTDIFFMENEELFENEWVTKETLSEYISACFDNDDSKNFFMDYEGLSLAINPYEIMSYAGGRVIARLYYADYPELFKNSYEIVPDSYITPVFIEGEDYFTDLDGDGSRERLSYSPDIGEYDYYYGVYLGIDGKEKYFNAWCYDAEGFYVKAPGVESLYFFCYGDNDIEYLAVYDISAGTVIEADSSFYGGRNDVSWTSEELSDGAIIAYGYGKTTEVITDPSGFNLSHRTQILSTDHGMKRFSVGKYGLPVSDEQFYKINYPTGHRFTLIADLEVTLLADDGSETVFKKTIPSGSEIYLIRTDEETIVDFALPGGGEGRAEVSSGWPQLINGVDIEEVLSPCLFAG
ncbi:MAG: hypothetical protein MJ067_03975 [Oscillospiraceae bacterium]|nr:hypothetical protein [Oscillospiraceae bacterium]